MKPHYKTAGEAMHAAGGSVMKWDEIPEYVRSDYEHTAQTFLASEWGESDPEPFCSECARSGHATADCPFPARHVPMFPELETNA